MMEPRSQRHPKAPLSGNSSRPAWRNQLGRMARYRGLYFMLVPVLVWYALFEYAPMYGVTIAFKDYSFFDGILGSPWADPWHKHFSYFFNSPYFEQLLTNTLLISLYKLVFGMLPPLLLAIALSECRIKWLSRVAQTLSYMPYFLSWVIIYGIALIFFSESSGVVNRLIEQGGGNAIDFLTSPEWFRSMLVGTDIWKDAGWGAIIYLAAIAGINPTLYEAAEMDGANRIERIWHITLPGIRDVFLLLLILRLGSILNAGFEQVYVFYNVQVYSVGDIIDTWVYRTGLEQLNFSVAAAVGLFKSAIGFVLVLVTNAFARRWGGGIW